tara:strand:+ start:157 stop:357 length:201 start_codon:yes stop_codon:yes gene_type:complete
MKSKEQFEASMELVCIISKLQDLSRTEEVYSKYGLSEMVKKASLVNIYKDGIEEVLERLSAIKDKL